MEDAVNKSRNENEQTWLMHWFVGWSFRLTIAPLQWMQNAAARLGLDLSPRGSVSLDWWSYIGCPLCTALNSKLSFWCSWCTMAVAQH